MLSQADYYKEVPKDYLSNLKYRQKLLEIGRRGPREQEALRQACRDDILFYINSFVFQFNPKKKGQKAVGPFITWDFQDEALVGESGILWCYEHNRSAVVEKSREMGATWLFLIFQDWLCKFHPYVQALNISRSAEAVDDKSRDSLFAKIRFMHRHLPDWLNGPVDETKMYFGFGRTESEITGEASTGRAGVGGRASVIFVDEFAKIREDTEIRARTANTADCRFFNSTHQGMATEFFKLTQTPEFIKLQFHWTQHPEKWPGAYRFIKATNSIEVLDKQYEYPVDWDFQYTEAPLGGPFPGIRSPWYDKKSLEIGSPRRIAEELDIDAGGSTSKFFSAMRIRHLVLDLCCPPYWEGDIAVDWASGGSLGLVENPGGPLKLWIQPRGDRTVPEDRYVAGADISQGSGATNSCLSIASKSTGLKVGEYVNPNVSPEKFAGISTALCWVFKSEGGSPAKLAWECPGPGQVFGKQVVEIYGFSNIYYRASKQLFARTPTYVPGWHNSPDTLDQLMGEYRAALEARKFVNRSELALQECLRFEILPNGHVAHEEVEGGDDPSGAKTNHSDRAIADAICCMMTGAMALNPQAKELTKPLVPVGSLQWRRDYWERKGREDW